jgi:hypothetical protein
LALLNSGLSVASARTLAGTLTQRLGAAATPETDAAFITSAFEHVLTRPPSVEERAKCTAFLRRQPAAGPHLRARENLIHVLFNPTFRTFRSAFSRVFRLGPK